MNALEKAQAYSKYLSEEGYHPNIDSDGDVIFKVEGGTYYIDIDAKDEAYFRIVFPNFWKIESNEELMRVIIAANHATMLTKSAKVYVNSDGKHTTASIEMFLPRPEEFRTIFPRSMSALKASVNNFLEKMKELS